MSNDERAAAFRKWLDEAPEGLIGHDTAFNAGAAWGQARAAIAQQPAKRDDTGRTPTDYALEHAEYLARGAEQFLDAVNRYGKAVTEITEESEVDAAEAAMVDLGRGLRADVYEFRKRRDRAAIAQPAEPAQQRELPDAIRVPLHKLWADAGYLVGRAIEGDRDLAVHRFKSLCDEVERAVRAALAAQADAQPVAPEGWKLVPVEPTKEMDAAYHQGFLSELHKPERRRTMTAERAGWLAMLAAAPAAAPPARQPLTLDQTRDLVKECGFDWNRGFVPLFDGDETNRYAVLVQEVERLCGIGREGE